MICILVRISRISLRERPYTSFPLKSTCPSVFSISLKMVRPVVDLPHPDSPTRPIVVPRFKVKETSSTAFTAPTCLPNIPPLIGKYFLRWDTSRMLSDCLFLFSAVLFSLMSISPLSRMNSCQPSCFWTVSITITAYFMCRT
ncbi:unknown [Ruminococcus sp. CAG:60]|nr:unknown [Ruminococcus sp. CAG:60]